MASAPVARAQDSGIEKTEGVISGTVVLEAGARTADQVAVSLRSHAAGVFRSILTDFDGHFEVRGLPAGTYEILVEEAGYEPVRTSVQLDGSSANVALHLRPFKASPSSGNKGIVSVRELKIPEKALRELQKGLERLVKNDVEGSLAYFKKATAAFPEYYEAHYHAGVAEMRLGHRPEAMEAFQKSVDLSDGQYAWANFGIGYLLYLEGKPREAESVVRRGLEVDDRLPDGHVILGMVLLQLGRPDEAERSAREALLRNPNYAEAYLVLSDVYGRRRDYGAQLHDLNTYLKLEPTGPGNERIRHAREMTLGMLAKAHPQQ